MLDAISRAEGTTKNGYNEVLGYGAYGRPSKPITDMTLQEVHDFGRNTLFAGQRAAGKTGPLSSATGRYQITGDNIKAYSKKWGLDMKTTKWTPQLQDRIAIDLAKNTPKGLANWEGFKTKTGQKLKQQAIAALNGQNVSSTAATASAASGDPQVAQLQQSLKAAGAKITVDGIMGPQTRKAMADYPDTAMAYTSTGATTTPALQAAAAQAAGQPSRSGNITRSGEDVAAMQRDLNSRGAKLIVDGKEGPLTRAAAQQFYGSPTSVRTPSFTSTPATTSNNWSSLQSPYTSSTGGANALVSSVRTPSFTYDPTNSRQVPTVAVHSDVRSKSPIPGYYDSQAGSNQTIQGGRRVPVDTGYSPPTGPVLTGGFSPPAPTQNQWSSLQGPYMGSTGGANAWSSLQQPYPAQAPVVQVPTARIPQARPDYQPPQQAVPATTAGMSLADLQAMAEKYGVPVGHIAQVASDIGNRAAGAYHESQRSGMGYSGGNYSGGSYGGAGGRSINTGVGGAYKNR
jgi:muramidase (phage lysozyme)